MNIYKLKQSGVGVEKLTKRVNLKGFIEHLNIDGETSRVVGFTPDYIGIKPSKFIIKKRNYFNEFLEDKLNFINKKFPKTYNTLVKVLLKPRVTITGGYDSSSKHLRTMFSPNKPNLSEEEILNILGKSNFKWFNIPYVKFEDTEELHWCLKFNPKSKPGFYTTKLLKFNKRGQSIFTSLEIAKKLFNLIKMKPMKNYYLWEILGREKDLDISEFGTEKEHSARIVLSTEEPVTILLCWFAQKITAALNTTTNKFDVKEKFDFKKYHKYHEYREKYDYYLDADWQGFDSNVEAVFIKIALSILLSEISTIDKEHMRICFFIMSSMLTKYVLVPPGIVVEMNKSVPSGSPFTTLTNCYVNLIYWALIGYEIYGDNYADNMELTIYGDDALVFFKYNDKLFEIDSIIKNIGIKSDPLINRFYPCKIYGDTESEPDFLKRNFNYVEVFWNKEKMWQKLLYQSKERTLNEQILQLTSYCYTAPFDEETFRITKMFISEMFIKHYKDLSPDVVKEINNFDKIFNENKKNYLHNSTINKYNEGSIKELKLLNYNISFIKDDYYNSFAKHVITSEDLKLMTFLAIPIPLINKYLRKELLFTFFNNSIYLNDNPFIYLKNPKDVVKDIVQELLHPT